MPAPTSTNTCSDCQYFHQHYVRHRNGTYGKTGFGHCSRPRIKIRKPGVPACDKFLPRPDHT